MRLLSLLATGVIIAWLIRRAVAALEAPGGGFGDAAPWLALAVAVALAYGVGLHRLNRRGR